MTHINIIIYILHVSYKYISSEVKNTKNQRYLTILRNFYGHIIFANWFKEVVYLQYNIVKVYLLYILLYLILAQLLYKTEK